MGEVRIKGAGYDVEPNNSTVVKGMNAGRLLYEPMHGGYGAVVALGQNYSLQGLLRHTHTRHICQPPADSAGLMAGTWKLKLEREQLCLKG